MANTGTNKKETEIEIDKAKNFIREIKEGKYTEEKPDLMQSIIYTRMEIQEDSMDNIFNDYSEDVILYGISC